MGVVILLLGGLVTWYQQQPAARPTGPVAVPRQSAPAARPAEVTTDDGGLGRLFRDEKSDTFVEATARVARILPDDTEGSAHQRFLVRLSSGQSVLIAHNIDLAQRVPVKEGDSVRFRGEYEWTRQGGTVHWTHRNPNPRGEKFGWIEHNGRRYE